MATGRNARGGVVLLEALVALAILGVAGGAMAALAVGASTSVRRAQDADDETRRASALLEAVALWPREDLDRHLGTRVQGAWQVDVERPAPMLYTVSVADSTGRLELLHTALYRPRPAERPADAR
jgi:type II secretory pathway pseudopilin PulG